MTRDKTFEKAAWSTVVSSFKIGGKLDINKKAKVFYLGLLLL